MILVSTEAEFDLNDIFDYTFAEFGVNQAVVYLTSFDEVFSMLLDNPEAGRERPEIRKGLRSFVWTKHVVF